MFVRQMVYLTKILYWSLIGQIDTVYYNQNENIQTTY